MSATGLEVCDVPVHPIHTEAELEARLRSFESTDRSESLPGLLDVARFVRGRAYAPYSRFSVGAALLAADGRVFIGTNVENASYGLTICAERSALFAAVTAGARSFEAIAIAGPDGIGTAPCGACRQVLAEFGRTLAVWYTAPGGAVTTDMATLLPGVFTFPL